MSDANFNDNDEEGYRDGDADVGSYPPNAWGLYDMHGNVAEWCSDWYTSELGASDAVDPVGPAKGSEKVYRGGRWHDNWESCRSAKRDKMSRENENGFRVVVEMPYGVAPLVDTSKAGESTAEITEVALPGIHRSGQL